MSIACYSRVWQFSRQSGNNLLVMLALADYADDTGLCWPGLATVAQKARLSVRQVIRIIHDLEGAGELYIRRSRSGNRYVLNVWPHERDESPHCERCGSVAIIGADGRPMLTEIMIVPKTKGGQDTPDNRILLCGTCKKLIQQLGKQGFRFANRSDIARSCDIRVTSPSDTAKSLRSDTAMSPDPSKNRHTDPSMIAPQAAPSQPPAGPAFDAEAFLAETRDPQRRTSALLTPGGLAGMSDDEKAAIASPVMPRVERNADPTDWENKWRAAASKKTVIEHGFTMTDVIEFGRRFSELSGIQPPIDTAQIRQWQAGIVGCLYQFYAQFSNKGMGKGMIMRSILWCLDLTFSDYSPIAHITISRPHSLVSSCGLLGADLLKMQDEHRLSRAGMPTEDVIASYYKAKGQKGKAQHAITQRGSNSPTDDERAAMLRVIRGTGNGGANVAAAS